jgi:predicted exporter
MKRALAPAWLAVVIAAGLYLVALGASGFPIRTDLLALLPNEDRDPVVQQAKDAMARNLGRHVLLAFGDADRGRAREAARLATGAIAASGLIDPLVDDALQQAGQRMAAFYFANRGSLLSATDRAALEAGRPQDVATRALAQAFGFASPVDATLLAADPFLLTPSFLNTLPGPLGRLALDEGMLSVEEGALYWVFVPMTLKRDPFDLEAQDRLMSVIDGAMKQAAATMPDVKLLRLGAIFFAEHGARTAIDEITWLAILETGCVIVLIVGVFRRLSPLVLNMLALGVGIAVAFAGTFAIFGEIHVAALLFGTSLIGVAVDYGLHYCTTAFGRSAVTGRQRLAFVLPGIRLGLLTALIGYAALFLAPFPGLKQIAVFAVIGLVGAFLTVVLWFPILDRMKPLTHGARMLRFATLPWIFWTEPNLRLARAAFIALVAVVLVAGLLNYRADDDVRRLQALSPALLQQQDQIKRLAGASTDAQHILVSAPDDEAALQSEEALAPVLDRLIAERAISGYQMPAAFVPSAARQRADRALVTAALQPLLAAHLARLGLSPAAPPGSGAPGSGVAGSGVAELTVARTLADGSVPLLNELVVAPGIHIVTLQGLARPDLVRAALHGQTQARFVEPTADFSRLLGSYRARAVLLTAASVLLVSFVMAWRYGPAGAFWTVLPAVTAALLVPAVLGLLGDPFTFFHAMGLILVIAIGLDYTIFCAETPAGHQSITMLGILLATCTTLLSFGLLGLSTATAVRAFGVTMLIGIASAYLLAPLASRAAPRGRVVSA